MSSIDAFDLVWGAEQIALLINRTKREVFYLLATGQIKGAFKMGGRWVISLKALRANFGVDTLSSASVDPTLFAEFDALMRQLSPQDQQEIFQYWT